MTGLPIRRHASVAASGCALLLFQVWACAGNTVRVDLEPGVCAALKEARALYLECHPAAGQDVRSFLSQYLGNPLEWRIYRDRKSIAIQFERLKADIRRRMLLRVFDQDYVDNQGWWHTALYSEQDGLESLWVFCEWVTGRGTDYRKVLADPRNRLSGPMLENGQRVLIPAGLLLDVMRSPAPKHVPEPPKPAVPEPVKLPPEPGKPAADDPPVDLDAAATELTYGSDSQGAYACYRLKPGEALFSAVVVRFTDYRDNDAIRAACETVKRRNGIGDVRGMKPGQKILIPLDMLSDRFLPTGSAPRKDYEETLIEAKRLRKTQTRSKDLNDVVVVIDPGHGGRDQGCASDRLHLYEDEINYDIACRVKRILENETQARVYMTLVDRSQGFASTDCSRFQHDTDEELLTTPPHDNWDAKVSANLRWYLANAIYRDELKHGTNPRKILLTSFHTDALFNSGMGGAMIYIPGSKYRRESEQPGGVVYAHYQEAQHNRVAASTAAERRRDEALSRNFAEDLMAALARKHIRRHQEGASIRSQIRQDGGQVYVPCILRNTLIPTKVLVEVANMTNSADCEHLADPKWRQSFAEAYVDALSTYFGS